METLGRGARVLILDTGFDPATPWVFPAEVRSFGYPGPPRHGSAIASIIACQSPACLGIAPACELFIASVVSSRRWDHHLAALRWAFDLRPHVINMSFAFSGVLEPAFAMGLGDLERTGTIMCAAYHPHLPQPHTHPAVVPVSGASPGGRLRTGRDECTLHPCHAGTPFRGVSAATAVASGIAACAKAYDPSLTKDSWLARLV